MADTGVNLRNVREHNRALLLTHILRAGGLSRVELAERTGLTQQAVSKIVPELLDAGLLDEERQASTGVGKPRTQLTIRAGARHALGARLDRDEYRVLRTNLIGEVEETAGGPLPAGFTPEQAVEAIGSTALELADGFEVLGLGLGAVDPIA
ncbi:MarR family transcriptional regulator, partial [Amycolatopsis pretoriensis]|uniref:MarR family transcriptional regulator n=1 Tax=Amycolatopsis pretoriensis TaxID=218821 RepID=UPI001178BE32